MRTIPEIREALHAVADRLTDAGWIGIADEIHALATETKRRPPIRKTRRKYLMTPQLRADILEISEAFPDTPYVELAACLKTTTARISEVLAGKRSA